MSDQLTKRDLWRSRRYRGVACWYGVPGAGKTYELARWGLQQRAAGRPVWCSFGFSLPGCYTFETIEDFVAIPDGAAICWDEAPAWLDSRSWKNMDPTVLVRLTHIRKYDIHLRYTAIEPSMVEKRLRAITFDWVECRSIGRRGPFNRLQAMPSPEGAPKLRSEPGPIRIRKMHPAICTAYDTRSEADVSAWLAAMPQPKRRAS